MCLIFISKRRNIMIWSLIPSIIGAVIVVAVVSFFFGKKE
ncbi:GlsB/YeaQ/YmgE family stress response membrane protein [Peptostreptococcus stomatis]|nr:GlsB/YeaQ/YmgE family stress response membrane protein [Peptostreptococcus stomatis]